jgi:exonuclease SbcC
LNRTNEPPTPLPDDFQTDLQNSLSQIKYGNAAIKEAADQLAGINKKVDELGRQIAELAFEEPVAPKPDPFDDAALNAAAAAQQRIDIELTREALTRAREAAVRIEGLEKQVDEKSKLLGEKKAAYAAISAGIAEGAEERLRISLDIAKTRHAELTEKYTELKSEIARTEAASENTKKTLSEIEAKAAELETLAKEITASKTEAAEWELVSKAFGRDGIQALELDALAPGISETANRILQSAYGDRFKIAIETTRIGGAGKKTKQIEDFIIKVTDSGDGGERLLENLSGGESIWIKRAIYDAFAAIRKRNTAFAFLTCFQDETDGALDSAAKTAYCRMLEAGHAESGLRHTIIITHSDEVKAMIEQKIDMEALEAAA